MISGKPELLSPAGDSDSAYAAFQYGADAVYLGLQRFSARAEATNFSADELAEVIGWAHCQAVRRKVYAAVNTVILDAELPDVAAVLGICADLGVDAVIVQDLGVARMVKRCFPSLRLHASTQMAAHNVEGVQALRDLGFHRVTLARELTLGEIVGIAGRAGCEIEVFIHGALCYSYSGLCLYSSLLRDRSGNRGRCTYPCRDSFVESGSGDHRCFPFSMKDLALTDRIEVLSSAGVASFKIEGRKKSALYVASTTAMYRAIVDGQAGPPEIRRYEEDIKTVFARPWTGLYVADDKNRDIGDAEMVGHRGAPVGEVLAAGRRVRFITRRALERHDGLQIDIAGEAKPFGFPVDELYLVGTDGVPENVVRAPAGALVEVTLPIDRDQVRIPRGAPVYCSSSQEVKRAFRVTRPRPDRFRSRLPMKVVASVCATRVEANATVQMPDGTVAVAAEIRGVFEKSQNETIGSDGLRQSFSRLGNTPFSLADLTVENPENHFIQLSLLNDLRRRMVDQLRCAVERHRDGRRASCISAVVEGEPPGTGTHVRWSVKTDRIDALDGFTEQDWMEIDEVVVDLDGLGGADPARDLARLSGLLGSRRIRIALPVITRDRENQQMRTKIRSLGCAGYRRWEASNISAWTMLKECADGSVEDLTSDWALYVCNAAAATQLHSMGTTGFTLSPEDSLANMMKLVGRFGSLATVIIYQDTPLFIAEHCVRASLDKKCKGEKECRRDDVQIVSGSGEHLRRITRGCRTIVINDKPFSIVDRVENLISAGCRRLRVDFVWRSYKPDEAVRVWRSIRQKGSIALACVNRGANP